MTDTKVVTNSTTVQESSAERRPSILPPPTAKEIDRLRCHNALQQFGEALGEAAKAVFPNNARPRYRNVHVLLLSWEDEDPQLPVSLEISKLFDVFVNVFHFQAEIWHIPNENSHNVVSKKVLEFVGDDSKDDMKIVYYAGHGRLTQNRLLSWTSWRHDQGLKCPTVAWSGVQNILEQAQSDVLILLDCCASGTVNTDCGQGVTELIAACSFNSIANGVGRYSFTKELTTELETLSVKPSFTTEQLYNNIYRRIQVRMPENGRERHPAPIRLVLTNEASHPRNLQLSKLSNPQKLNNRKTIRTANMGSNRNVFRIERSLFHATPAQQYCSPMSSPISAHGAKTLTSVSIRSTSYPTKIPRLSLAFRLVENLRVCDLSTNSFTEWLRSIPATVEEVKVEAGLQLPSPTQTQGPGGFYSYLFEKDRIPTRMLVRLLEGIGEYIIHHIGNPSEKFLLPSKLASFYKSVGGNYDSLFIDTPHTALSWIWASIGCEHLLLQGNNKSKRPSVPALTKSGFVRWQSIEILLGPDEHVPFMQMAVQNFPIKDPDTNELFPKDLPAEVFPSHPDPELLEWHSACAKMLRRQTEFRRQPSIPSPDLKRSTFENIKSKSKTDFDLLPGRCPRSQSRRPTRSRISRQNPGSPGPRKVPPSHRISCAPCPNGTSKLSHISKSLQSDVQIRRDGSHLPFSLIAPGSRISGSKLTSSKPREPFRGPLLPASESDLHVVPTLRSYLRMILSEDEPLTIPLRPWVPVPAQIPEISLNPKFMDNSDMGGDNTRRRSFSFPTNLSKNISVTASVSSTASTLGTTVRQLRSLSAQIN